MVDARVIAAVSDLLRQRPLRILVTGGTGFVGSRVAFLLAAAGQQVTVSGRNLYRVGRGRHPAVEYRLADLRDRQAVAALCRDHDAIIHSAALAATWGEAQSFYAHNVQATENIVQACRELPATRLVHVSSTAIHFDFRDRLGIEDDAPLPATFACEYAKSKALAEGVVQQAVRDGLNAVIVRARAVFGPGDNSLLPRLLHAARQGRLPQIGNGQNVVDLTYVDNLAYALCLAIVRGAPGEVCTITNEEPVSIWPTLNSIVEHLRLPTTRRKLPYRAALAVASTSQWWHGMWRRPGEPALTPYSVGLLAKSQTFSPTASRQMLGYSPIVTMDEAQQRTLDALVARDDAASPVSAEVRLFTTGFTSQPYFFAERGQGREKIPFHGACALITHPRYGHFLFDTGYASFFFSATQRLPYSIYARLTPVVHAPQLSICSQLAELGISPRDIRGIIISHFHADHVAGLRDFESSDLIASQAAWHSVSGRRGLDALRRGFIPELLPDDFTERLHLLEHFHDPGIGPFARSHDLFGDGSVRLVELPGHACGQIGALVQHSPTQRKFLVADATWTLNSLRANALPDWRTFGFVDSVADMRRTLTSLHQFSVQYPEIEIIPTHCPGIAERYDFMNVVNERGAR